MERKSNKNVEKDGGFEKLMCLLCNAFYGGIYLVARASDDDVMQSHHSELDFVKWGKIFPILHFKGL